ncbi:hypothetical protein [Burkholderia gladioli]|uniref:hypothetical protein n=1 Tax=Burkholderia gladioli TaxID=28095 RepID=UPI00163FE69E|nr:hypothetical protein [Burkholderia gladioli]
MTTPILIGYVPVIEEMPSFGIPIFKINNTFYVQNIDNRGRISDFVEQDGALISRLVHIPPAARPISRFRVGDDAYFIFDTQTNIFAGTGIEVALKINQTQDEKFYREYPFLYLEVSDFCAFYLDQNRNHSFPPMRLADAFLEIKQKQAVKGLLLGKPYTEKNLFFTFFRDTHQRQTLFNIENQFHREYKTDLAGGGSALAYENFIKTIQYNNNIGLLVCNISKEDHFGEHLAEQFADAGLTRIDVQTPEDYQRVLDALNLFQSLRR